MKRTATLLMLIGLLLVPITKTTESMAEATAMEKARALEQQGVELKYAPLVKVETKTVEQQQEDMKKVLVEAQKKKNEEFAKEQEKRREERRKREEEEERRRQEELQREQEALERARAEEERLAELERIEQEERERAKQEQAVLEPEPEVVTEEKQEEPEPANEPPALTHEAELLAKIVEAEATGESYAGKVAVAEVILNRVRSNEFPNSIEAVIYQSGQFSPVSDGRINTTPTNETYTAISEAMSGSNYTGGALYFYNPATATDRWLDTLPVKAVIGNHYFK